jgi:hypothetical protein
VIRMSPVHGFNRCNAPRHATSLVVLAGERPCLVSVSFPPSTHTQAFHNHPNLIHQQHTHPPHAMSHGSASASASGSSIEHRRVSATGLHPLPDGARSSSLGVGSNIGGLGIAASPPFLPMPRQPSPLHLSINVDDPSSSSTSQPPSPKLSLAPSTSSSAPTEPPAASHPPPPPAPVFRAVSNPHESLVPVQPQPDSLLYRTSISQLDASATTLKKLTKAVISHAAVYTRILDELERADDELCASLGELGRWLEAGYGVKGGVWDDDYGVRNTRKGKYRAKKEEMEAMIDGPVKAVRADLKRQGLAGGGAQDRYEVS